MVILGEASYALYLVHFMFNDWSKAELGFDQGLVSAIWKLAIVIPLSVALHFFVERPGRRVILNWWRSRHPTPKAVTPAGVPVN